MACKVIKKLLGYELCCLEPEGTLFFADHITLIRKAEYTELFNLETKNHEIGDYITRDITRKAVYRYITDHKNDFWCR